MKFNAVLSVLLLAGSVCANDLAGEKRFVQPKAMTAPPAEESAKYADAQFKYGVYCKEKLNDDKNAYLYLELAAKQKHRGAWLYLGKCYFNRKDEHPSYLLWSKLCYLAAERLSPDAETEFNIGLLEGLTGNLEEYKKWMKLAADKGFSKAAETLANKETEAAIIAVRNRRKPQKNSDALKQAIDSHNEKVRQITGTTAQEVFDQLSGRTAVSKSSNMIKLPHPKGIVLPNWNYNSQATEDFIAENLMADRDGDMRWMCDEFKTQPVWENLLYPNPTIRTINATYEEELTKSLDKSGFKRCSKEDTKRMIKPFMDPEAPKDFYDDDIVWELGNHLYFRLHTDTSGRWMMRYYQFFIYKDGKTIGVETFPNPPDVADAALIMGIIQNNADCWNNMAVKYVDGEMDNVFRRDDEAEEILKELVKRRHAVGTYNLAVFYQNRSKAEEAKKYFALAEEFAGSSVIDPQAQLPEIFDRNGELLVKNRLARSSQDGFRLYPRGGRFAAALLGDIAPFNKMTRTYSEGGFSGIEEIIFRKNITHPIYLTLDSVLQGKLETLIFDIAEISDPKYVYGIIVNSKGELLAAAQSPFFDLVKRDREKLNPSAINSWVFMPAGYVFPVADQWMKLLDSASDAPPAAKEKLKLHIKQGVFTGEAQGVVLGINRMKGVSDPGKVSGQMATLMNYLYAYIGAAEKKAIPLPVVYTDKINAPVKSSGNVEWISFYRPSDGIVVNALGVIKTDDHNEKLYICIRAVHAERDFAAPPSAEVKKTAAAKADKAEKIIRNFNLNLR